MCLPAGPDGCVVASWSPVTPLGGEDRPPPLTAQPAPLSRRTQENRRPGPALPGRKHHNHSPLRHAQRLVPAPLMGLGGSTAIVVAPSPHPSARASPWARGSPGGRGAGSPRSPSPLVSVFLPRLRTDPFLCAFPPPRHPPLHPSLYPVPSTSFTFAVPTSPPIYTCASFLSTRLSIPTPSLLPSYPGCPPTPCSPIRYLLC